MKKETKTAAAILTGAITLSTPVNAANSAKVRDLITQLKSSDEKVRTKAWLGAGEVGPVAIKPLAKVMVNDDLEVARAAKRAMWKIVHHVGRPEAAKEKRAAVLRLHPLLEENQPDSVRVEVTRMLSEIGGKNVIGPLVELLKNKALREDARQALQRIPGMQATGALRAALEFVPEDLKTPIVAALRARGEKVAGYPCQKLVPTKITKVAPSGNA